MLSGDCGADCGIGCPDGEKFTFGIAGVAGVVAKLKAEDVGVFDDKTAGVLPLAVKFGTAGVPPKVEENADANGFEVVTIRF